MVELGNFKPTCIEFGHHVEAEASLPEANITRTTVREEA
jgi:hypothetical protein